MKKKLIIISVVILFAGIIWGAGFIFISENKVDKENADVTLLSKKVNNYEEKRTFYKKSIPKVEQDYTVLHSYNADVFPVLKKSEEVLDDANISIDNELANFENNAIQNENEITKEEISEIPSGENINETNDLEVISSENISLIETEEKIDSAEFAKTQEEEKEEGSIVLQDISYETVLVQDEPINLKNGFYEEGGNSYYYENDIKVTGLKNINGVNNYFSPTGKYLGTNNIKVVDVSYYQKDIDWNLFANESDCYGVILRLGYYETLDKKFERNISELKRLNIPYGIYLFSYSSTLNGAKKEAEFTNKMITKYDINPSLGIYYDIESWSTKTSNSNNISKTMYDNIIQHYINSVSYYTNYKYKVRVYSGRWYAMNRLGNISKKYVDWVAEYNKTCKYDGEYSMWQYTSKGSVPGINGNVDISYIL